MVEHEVDNHAGEGYVKPDPECGNRDSAMVDPVATIGSEKRQVDHGKHDHRQQQVREEDGQVEISQPVGGLGVVGGVDAVEVMIDEIAREESRGDGGGGDHSDAVCAPAAGLDEVEAEAKEDATGAI